MISNTPLVSIIIPTYNNAKFISAAIDSAAKQTYPNIEIIVVDDGSTDQTKNVILPYQHRIRYIHQSNEGLAAARNKAIEKSKGDYLQFLDADDLIHPEKIKKQIDCLMREPQFDVVY